MTMIILEKVRDIRGYLDNSAFKDKLIGLVPTMGALHEGHLSLVDIAASQSDIVIISIFVNPNQFNDPNDLKNYPRDIQKDLELLKNKKVDVVFIPTVSEIYPQTDTRVFDFDEIERVMEGAHRPGHFNGVAQVVSRLFEITTPDLAFFGQKDYQQLLIIKALVKKLGLSTKIISCPIVREKNGLAMSSRNQLLSEKERDHASKISATLFKAKELKNKNSVSELKKWVISELNKDPLLNVEYFEIADGENLVPIENWEPEKTSLGFIAVKLGKVRLIDNIIFD